MAEPKTVPLDWKVDDRGFLAQIYQSTDGHMPPLKRIYIVGNFDKGTIRAFHGHHKEWKGFFVPTGAVQLVVVKETEGEKPKSFFLAARKPEVLFVPPGYYNGWKALEDNTLLICLSSSTLEESLGDDFRKDPFAYGKELWEVKHR